MPRSGTVCQFEATVGGSPSEVAMAMRVPRSPCHKRPRGQSPTPASS